MAVSVDQMAGAYLTNLTKELERIKQVSAEHQKTIVAMEAHIEDCKASMQAGVAPASTLPVAPVLAPTSTIIENADGSTTEKFQLPNPFDKILTKIE